MNKNYLIYGFIILGILIYVPLAYIQWFLILELKNKYGYFRFVLILFGFIIFYAVIIFLLSQGYISFITFLLLPIIINLIGVWFLRKGFVKDLRKLFTLKK